MAYNRKRRREHVREADALASGLTVRAGFDPLPAVGYLMEQHKAAAQVRAGTVRDRIRCSYGITERV